jgi:hypothetical protein
MLLVATLLVIVPNSLGLIRSVTLCPLMIFVIKKSFFLNWCLLFCCLRAFEYHPSCFRNIQVLWQRYVMSSVILVNDEFFLSCVICNNSATVQCERISLKYTRCTVPLRKVVSSVISAVSVMTRNKSLHYHAALSRPGGSCFYRYKSIYGPFSFFPFLPCLCLLAFSLCKTLISRAPSPPLSSPPSSFSHWS